MGAIWWPSTIFDMAANIAMEYPQPIKSIPLYDTIREYLDDRASEVILNVELDDDELVGRRSALFFSRRNPQLLSCKYPLHGCRIQH